jgi:hypothetical protein
MRALIVALSVLLLLGYRLVARASMETKADLYDWNYDEVITKKFVESFGVGRKMPNLRGFGRCYYANQAFPDLSLEEAVQSYKQLRDEEDANRVYPPRVACMSDVLKTYRGIRVVDWDNERDGILLHSYENDADPNLYIASKDHNRNIEKVELIINTAVQLYKDHGKYDLKDSDIDNLAFSGHVCFVMARKDASKLLLSAMRRVRAWKKSVPT